MSFAAFMDAALYDADGGFFATNPVGTHFATAPHISPVFAACVASMVTLAARNLGGGADIRLIEGGAGDGTLAQQLLASAPALEALQYCAIEKDPLGGAVLAARALPFASVEVHPTPDLLARRGPGVIFANELFDNVPFHRLRDRDGTLVEVTVGLEEGAFVEMERPASPELVTAAAGRLPTTGEVLVSPAARELLAGLLTSIDRGYVVLVDYGDDGDGEGGPVRGYRGHEAVTDLVADPGSCDITGPVDMRALRQTAEELGWEPAGAMPVVTQRTFLHTFGYRAFVDDLADRQGRAEEEGNHRRALSLWNARGEATLLVDERELGAFKVLGMKTAGLPNLW